MGVMLQGTTNGRHYKSEVQLKEMANQIGRERILIIYGTDDKTIPVSQGRKLIKYIEPAMGIILEGMGHGLIGERSAWVTGLLEERFKVG
ncbi:hypothetical protein BKA56DRAFT_505791 [Ilyonectria sp. MPI-CAGE-AT-0026]|nr:hypothetical protein BKA56DRAFT_505791 [Ilyonectria sp. MPI-CAGE-AT-0026]